MNRNKVSLFLRLSRPVLLLVSVGQTLLGVGVARYLGYSIDASSFTLGLIWVLLVQLAAIYLNEYFDVQVDRFNINRTLFSGGSGVLDEVGSEEHLGKDVALRAFIVTASLAGAVTLSMILAGMVDYLVGIFMISIFGGLLLYSLPPVRFSSSGYGEIVVAIVVGMLIPSLGYGLQTWEVHRLLTLTGLPITFLILVYMLVVSFPDYATDLKFGKKTFLVRAGWQNVMTIHNSLIVITFIMLGSLTFFNYPRAIMLLSFIPMPLGMLQIWQMRQIENGVKPNWKLLTMNAAVMVGMLIYLFTYSFWTR